MTDFRLSQCCDQLAEASREIDRQQSPKSRDVQVSCEAVMGWEICALVYQARGARHGNKIRPSLVSNVCNEQIVECCHKYRAD